MSDDFGICPVEDPQAAQSRIFQHAIDHGVGPFGVLFELTRLCNLSCGFCYQPNHIPQNELSLAEIETLLDQLAASGTLFLTFTGGEVTTHSYFWEVIQMAVDKRFVVKIKTNGSTLRRDDARRLREMGVAELHVSIYHHLPELHDHFVGKAGALQNSLETLRTFKAAGGRVRAMTVLMNWNMEAAPMLQQLYVQEEIDHTFDIRVEPHLDGGTAPKAYIGDEQVLATIIPKVDFLRKQLERNRNAVSAESGICTIGSSSLYIAADGNVYPCSEAKSLLLGNVRSQSIEEIWAGEKRKNLTTLRWGQSIKCMECDISRFCHRCPASAAVEHGDVTKPASLDCQMARIRYLAYQQSEKKNSHPSDNESS